ncbi:hypothetical protein P6U16_09560 [Rhizobium sp. 32-5/1]|uniref:DUF3592 domain-containing protein n=1 Tax=Rhizobium sp. 32-5/1 TaxID=3019602 RepID=UPI00240DB890|nr:hypothetical protein [Rhizobium sp. 32-5/1]WEZ84769.1 hypothetical protein P6U16_09560 [Rhizobium sp. 32-5/1]
MNYPVAASLLILFLLFVPFLVRARQIHLRRKWRLVEGTIRKATVREAEGDRSIFVEVDYIFGGKAYTRSIDSWTMDKETYAAGKSIAIRVHPLKPWKCLVERPIAGLKDVISYWIASLF